MAGVLIGTSGWSYESWWKVFYPEDLASTKLLEFYSRQFPTGEVNYSFYHLPQPKTYEKWAKQVPEGFIFSVKASRFISHKLKLKNAEAAWRTFTDNASRLEAHLGPILLQLPSSFKCDLAVLSDFLSRAQAGKSPPRLVVEFRHESWFVDDIYKLLKKHAVALCIADGPKYPRRDVATTDFVYFRYHGRTQQFASNYSDRELKEEAARLMLHKEQGRTVYAYFNNDALGYAPANARKLTELCGKGRSGLEFPD